MGKWDTPPDGDFVRYVENLSRAAPPHSAHREMESSGASPATQQAAPGGVAGLNAKAVATALRAAAGRQGAAGAEPFVSNAGAPARRAAMLAPGELWQAVRLPFFAYIALEAAAMFVPALRPFTTLGLIALGLWAVQRLVKAAGGSQAWQQALRQMAEELKKQQGGRR